jgi:hypothetical protein
MSRSQFVELVAAALVEAAESCGWTSRLHQSTARSFVTSRHKRTKRSSFFRVEVGDTVNSEHHRFAVDHELTVPVLSVASTIRG